jgi:hypothetical protein
MGIDACPKVKSTVDGLQEEMESWEHIWVQAKHATIHVPHGL